MNRTLANINLPIFPGSVEDLLKKRESSNFRFIQAMDINTINSETVNAHYTAHQCRKQEGPRTLLMSVVEKLSFNPEGYCRLPSTAGEKLSAKQHNFFCRFHV